MVAESETQALVTLPQDLWQEAQRIAGEQNWTMAEAIVFLAKCGATAQHKAEENLKASYRRFMAEENPAKREEAGNDLMRAVFGPDAVGQD